MNISIKDFCELNNRFNFVPKRNIEVLAYIRFAKEDLTFKQCLDTILPTINKGVLVYHDQPESSNIDITKTLEIAKEFCKKNPGFKLVHYPHVVYGAGSPVYRGELGKDYQIENRIDTFYNFALDELKKVASTSDPYAMKVDGDHLFDAKAISEQIKLINECPITIDEFFIPTVNFCYLPCVDKVYFLRSTQHFDNFFVKANKISFDFYLDKETGMSYEKQIQKVDHKNSIEHFLSNNKILKSFVNLLKEKEDLATNGSYLNKLFTNLKFAIIKVFLIRKIKRINSKSTITSVVDLEPKYNSLHFPLQKRWEYHFGRMPTFEDFQTLGNQHNNGKYVELSEWVDPNNYNELSLNKSGLIPENSEPNNYLIQNHKKVLEISRSFYKD